MVGVIDQPYQKEHFTHDFRYLCQRLRLFDVEYQLERVARKPVRQPANTSSISLPDTGWIPALLGMVPNPLTCLSMRFHESSMPDGTGKALVWRGTQRQDRKEGETMTEASTENLRMILAFHV
jgi:hypothetical protein